MWEQGKKAEKSNNYTKADWTDKKDKKNEKKYERLQKTQFSLFERNQYAQYFSFEPYKVYYFILIYIFPLRAGLNSLLRSYYHTIILHAFLYL